VGKAKIILFQVGKTFKGGKGDTEGTNTGEGGQRNLPGAPLSQEEKKGLLSRLKSCSKKKRHSEGMRN